MLRSACLLIAITACAGSPPAARLFPAGTGECPDDSGCGVALGEEPKYAPPGEAQELPGDPDLGPNEAREATCSDVGISTAALEIGNYATEEERAPIATKYRGRCRTVKLDQAERHCVFEAGDAPTVAYCAPRFFPQHIVQLVDRTACAEIENQIRAHSSALPAGQPGPDLWERQLAVVRRSCEQDRWTVAFGECARSQQVPNHIAPYCQYVAPAPLVTRLQDRLAKVK